jgi:hypothetical protein
LQDSLRVVLPAERDTVVCAASRRATRAAAHRLRRRAVVFEARYQPGGRALIHTLVLASKALTAAVILAEFGDTFGFTSSVDAVGHSALDLAVW